MSFLDELDDIPTPIQQTPVVQPQESKSFLESLSDDPVQTSTPLNPPKKIGSFLSSLDQEPNLSWTAPGEGQPRQTTISAPRYKGVDYQKPNIDLGDIARITPIVDWGMGYVDALKAVSNGEQLPEDVLQKVIQDYILVVGGNTILAGAPAMASKAAGGIGSYAKTGLGKIEQWNLLSREARLRVIKIAKTAAQKVKKIAKKDVWGDSKAVKGPTPKQQRLEVDMTPEPKFPKDSVRVSNIFDDQVDAAQRRAIGKIKDRNTTKTIDFLANKVQSRKIRETVFDGLNAGLSDDQIAKNIDDLIKSGIIEKEGLENGTLIKIPANNEGIEKIAVTPKMENAVFGIPEASKLESTSLPKQPTPTEGGPKLLESSSQLEVNPMGRSKPADKIVGKEKARVISLEEDKLLRKQIADEARGAKAGFKEGVKITKEKLEERFIQDQKASEDLKNAIFAVIKDNLPKEEQSRFLGAIRNDMTRRKAFQIQRRVEQRAEELAQKESTANLTEFKIPKTTITPEYRRRLMELEQAFDFAKRTPSEQRKLTNLSKFLDENPDAFLLHPELRKEVQRISKIPVDKMTDVEKKMLQDTREKLLAQGRLKKKMEVAHNERLNKVERDRIIRGSQSIDPKTKTAPGDKNSGILTRLRWLTQKTHQDTSVPLRVLDRMDKYGKYKGANAAWGKRISAAETEASFNGVQRGSNLLEDIVKETGITEWTPEMQDTLHVLARIREGREDVAQKLISQMGYKGDLKSFVAQADKRLDKGVEVVRKYYIEKQNDKQAIWEMTRNEPFMLDPNYVCPLKYEGTYITNPADNLKHFPGKSTKTKYKSGISRQEGVEKPIRRDFFDQLVEGMAEEEYFLNVEPVVAQVKSIVNHPEVQQALGRLNSEYWNEFLASMTRNGRSVHTENYYFDTLLKQGKKNLINAVLGYRPTSAAIQLLSFFDALAMASTQYGSTTGFKIASEMSKVFTNSKYVARLIESSKALQNRRGGEFALKEMQEGTAKEVLKKGPGWSEPLGALQKLDSKTAAAAHQGVKRILLKTGMSSAEAEAEADIMMQLMQSSAQTSMRPLVTSTTETGKAMFTFQSTMLNRWGIIVHDIVLGGLKNSKTATEKINATIGLGFIAAAELTEQTIRDGLANALTGRDGKPKTAFQTATEGVMRNVPVLGPLLAAGIAGYTGGSSLLPPLGQVVERAIKNVGTTYQGVKDKDLAKTAKGSLGMLEAGATIAGIPGTSTVFDVLERFTKQSKASSLKAQPGAKSLKAAKRKSLSGGL